MAVEVVVRPAVFPDIRPQKKEIAAPTDPAANRTRWAGSDGQVIDLNLTLTQSITNQVNREEKRIYDIARIYKTTPAQDGGKPQIDKNTYVDVEMPHAIRMKRTSRGPTADFYFRKPKEDDYKNGNVEILEEDLERENPRE